MSQEGYGDYHAGRTVQTSCKRRGLVVPVLLQSVLQARKDTRATVVVAAITLMAMNIATGYSASGVLLWTVLPNV
ncbi:hypothetical protein M378DRAFT_171586, partial [Amanita muscaria Koide BX008]